MGKPVRVEKGQQGEWRVYKPSGFGELRVRYIGEKPAEIVADLARPADTASAALRQLALNESRSADEANETQETWKGTVGYEEWESVKVEKTDRGWTKVHGIVKMAATP
jgi:hypothetical protein